MSQSKVYLVSFEFLPFSNGGLARHATEIITRLLKLNKAFTSIIAVPNDDETNLGEGIIKISCIFYKNNYLGYIEFSIKLLLRFFKEYKTTSFIFFSSFSYLFNPFLPKKFYLFITNTTKRVYLTNYQEESWFERFVRKITYFFLFLWENHMSKKAIKVFAISDSTKKDIINQYKINDDNIKIISCALNKTIFRPSEQKMIFNKNLLFVGRLVPRKNIVDLIKIMRLLVDIDKGFVLNLIGGGENKYEKKLKKRFSKIIPKKNIIFHGKVTDDKLNKLYESSSIFVFTSLVEGFGLVLLEAMSKGLPVIAYNVNGVKDVIINKVNGYLVKPFDFKDFRNKILKLNRNGRIYQQMSKNALKRVDDFSWDISVHKLMIEI